MFELLLLAQLSLTDPVKEVILYSEPITNKQYIKTLQPNGSLVIVPVINNYIPNKIDFNGNSRTFYYDKKIIKPSVEPVKYYFEPKTDFWKTPIHQIPSSKEPELEMYRPSELK